MHYSQQSNKKCPSHRDPLHQHNWYPMVFCILACRLEYPCTAHTQPNNTQADLFCSNDNSHFRPDGMCRSDSQYSNPIARQVCMYPLIVCSSQYTSHFRQQNPGWHSTLFRLCLGILHHHSRRFRDW
jgi:hypothetical protein